MRTLDLVQGISEWHAHRANSLNASDAPAMLGCSPYRSRADLIKEKATGITSEVDPATQRIFDRGHEAEALARPLAETIIGEELYPCVGKLSGTDFSASFDGLTLVGDVAFEHKLLASRLREAMFDGCTGADLPEDYRAQMEQQCLVSGAEKVLFMASEWDNSGNLVEVRHCWYTPDLALRERIIAGWKQFQEDVNAYQPDQPPAPILTGKSPDSLPSLSVQVQGKVLASNLDAFREHAMSVLGNINTALVTDEDFADAEQTVKWCKGVEDKLALTKENIIGQMADIDAITRTLDEVSAEARRIRLDLDKRVKAEKEVRKTEIITHYIQQVHLHYEGINASLGQYATFVPSSIRTTIAEAAKGKRTLGSITDACDEAAANLKIEASQNADRIRACIVEIDKHADHSSLLPDRVQLAREMRPDDLRRLIQSRIDEHRQREAARMEAERERIRQEEAARIERERLAEERQQQELKAKEARAAAEATSAATQQDETGAAPMPVMHADSTPTAHANFYTIGDINAAIAPLKIDAAGLEQLGFTPAKQERAAKFYTNLPAICQALLRVIAKAQHEATSEGKAA